MVARAADDDCFIGLHAETRRILVGAVGRAQQLARAGSPTGVRILEAVLRSVAMRVEVDAAIHIQAEDGEQGLVLGSVRRSLHRRPQVDPNAVGLAVVIVVDVPGPDHRIEVGVARPGGHVIGWVGPQHDPLPQAGQIARTGFLSGRKVQPARPAPRG